MSWTTDADSFFAAIQSLEAPPRERSGSWRRTDSGVEGFIVEYGYAFLLQLTPQSDMKSWDTRMWVTYAHESSFYEPASQKHPLLLPLLVSQAAEDPTHQFILDHPLSNYPEDLRYTKGRLEDEAAENVYYTAMFTAYSHIANARLASVRDIAGGLMSYRFSRNTFKEKTTNEFNGVWRGNRFNFTVATNGYAEIVMECRMTGEKKGEKEYLGAKVYLRDDAIYYGRPDDSKFVVLIQQVREILCVDDNFLAPTGVVLNGDEQYEDTPESRAFLFGLLIVLLKEHAPSTVNLRRRAYDIASPYDFTGANAFTPQRVKAGR